MVRLVLSRSAIHFCAFFLRLLLLLCCLCSHSAVNAFSFNSNNNDPICATQKQSIVPGDMIPDVCLNWGFNPLTKVNMVEYTGDQSVLVVGVPAAFADAVSSVDVSKFFQHQAGLKAVGIENVIVYSVNDSAVVGIWNKQLVETSAAIGFPNSLLTFFGDPSGSFTKACGMELEQSLELTQMGLFSRCQTFVLWADKGVVRDVLVGDKDVINPPVIMQRIRKMISRPT